ncbi:MAG: alpha/beta fold hydrolase [Myxococcota bacterium]
MMRILLAFFLVSCSQETTPSAVEAGTMVPVGAIDREAQLLVPLDHDGRTERPLVVLLHGLGASAGVQDLLFQLSPRTRREGIYLVLPEGSRGPDGRRFWNATEECCDFHDTNVDDEGYLLDLLDEVEALVPVDRERVYFVGHSNGGFMSYRMACRHSDRITGVIAVAGLGFRSIEECGSPAPLNVLHIHGDADDQVPFAPYASEEVDRWAARANCAESTELAPIDLDTGIDGSETTRLQYTGCEVDRDVQLWTIHGGGHIPALGRAFSDAVIEWATR